MEFVSDSVAKTEEFAKKIAREIKPGDCIAFEGPMGMGKTAFVRGLAKGLGISCEVSSPTFSLVNEYKGENITLYHFDMYRVTTMDDLYSTGFFDYLDGDNVLAIEWSENIAFALEENTIFIRIEQIDENTRRIIVKGDERFENTRC